MELQGAAGQTADLLETQTSAGAVLAKIDNNGNGFYTSVMLPATAAAAGQLQIGGVVALQTYGTHNLFLGNAVFTAMILS